MADVGLAASANTSTGFGLGEKKKTPTNIVEAVSINHTAETVAAMRANPARTRLAPHLRKRAEWVAFAELTAKLAVHITTQGIIFGQRNPHATEPPAELVVRSTTELGNMLYEAYSLGVKLGDPTPKEE